MFKIGQFAFVWQLFWRAFLFWDMKRNNFYWNMMFVLSIQIIGLCLLPLILVVVPPSLPFNHVLFHLIAGWTTPQKPFCPDPTFHPSLPAGESLTSFKRLPTNKKKFLARRKHSLTPVQNSFSPENTLQYSPLVCKAFKNTFYLLFRFINR